MNELALFQNNLPTNIEDLSKFALIGREKLTAVRAEIRAIGKLKLANDVREQKLQEAQNIAEIVLDAETRMGELLKPMPQEQNNQYKKVEGCSTALPQTKQQTKKEIGISDDQAKRYIKLAENKPIVEQVKAEAREKGEIVTRQAVINKAKEVKKEQRHEDIKKKFENASDKDLTGGQILEGDLFEKIKCVNDNSIDLLFADPPYMILNQEWDTYKNVSDFMRFTENWLDVVVPKVKDTGRIYISFSQYYQFDLYNLLKKKDFYGFNFGQVIIWNYRNNNKPSDKKMYRFSYEPIFYLYGKQADILNFPPETYGEMQSNVWIIATPQSNFNEGKFHPAQKPVELLERIILTGSKEGDLVLDPFAGSGTTGIAAQKLNRNFILIEKECEYCQIARGRLNGVG